MASKKSNSPVTLPSSPKNLGAIWVRQISAFFYYKTSPLPPARSHDGCTYLCLDGAAGFGASLTFTTQTYRILRNDHIAGDFNGDGKIDLAGTSLNGAAVMLGNGTFGVATDFPIGIQTQVLAAGDFNGDGKIDLAVTLDSPQFSLALLIGTGAGSFNAPVLFQNTSRFDSAAVVATARPA